MRVTIPSRSSPRSVRVSMRCEMPSMDRRSSLKRFFPSPRNAMTRTLHFAAYPARSRPSSSILGCVGSGHSTSKPNKAGFSQITAAEKIEST